MTVILLPEATDPTDPTLIRWRVGPGMVRVSDELRGDDLPPPLRPLADEGVLESVTVAPGRIDTRLTPGQTAAGAGARVRTELHSVLQGPGGWPDDPGSPDPGSAADSDVRTRVSRAADGEIADEVRRIIDGPFGTYTASHGGSVELVDDVDGVVTVRLHGHCHGCAAADLTLQANLAQRLRTVPGYVSLNAVGESDGCDDHAGTTRLRTWLQAPRRTRH